MDAKDLREMRQLEINLRPLFFLQEKLDTRIKSQYEYDEVLTKEHFQKKVLAFRVEIAELLNALRYHKYWSQALPQPREEILEEYVDGLHFMLSIGIEKGVRDYQYKGFYAENMTADDLTYIFETLMTTPWQDLRKDDYLRGLEMYIRLGEILLFKWDEVKEAYTEKNIKNLERQEQGY